MKARCASHLPLDLEENNIITSKYNFLMVIDKLINIF
jgi:hypothetical protein